MVEFYTREKRLALDLDAWIQDTKRDGWNTFCRSMRRKYGVGPTKMLKVLREDYPSLRIEDDKLVKV